jgi:uncharacterized protein (TIGR02466 family)
MIEPSIHSIFPTPIYFTNLYREFTKKELSLVDKCKLNVNKNESNTTSSDTYILNHKLFKDLKTELDLIIQDYFNKIISSSNNIKPYITQSWLNYTEKNQFHHKHNHWNSFISGVVYINCNNENETITFFKEKHEMLNFETKEYNLWNSKTWSFVVNNGDVVLFPSELEHMVQVKTTDNTRISLSFNVFVKGHLGSQINLTKLILT